MLLKVGCVLSPVYCDLTQQRAEHLALEHGTSLCILQPAGQRGNARVVLLQLFETLHLDARQPTLLLCTQRRGLRRAPIAEDF